MTRIEKDEEREERIKMEIIVDTYSADEQAMGGTPIWTIFWTFPLKRAVTPSERNLPWRRAKRYAWLECLRQSQRSPDRDSPIVRNQRTNELP